MSRPRDRRSIGGVFASVIPIFPFAVLGVVALLLLVAGAVAAAAADAEAAR